MSTAARASTGIVSAGIAPTLLSVVVSALALPLLTNLTGSDAAGNALGQAYAAIAIILLWTLLTILALTARAKGAMPKLAFLAAILLIPASGFVAMDVLELLTTRFGATSTMRAKPLVRRLQIDETPGKFPGFTRKTLDAPPHQANLTGIKLDRGSLVRDFSTTRES
jgi:hypothetical protein